MAFLKLYMEDMGGTNSKSTIEAETKREISAAACSRQCNELLVLLLLP